MTNAPVAQLSEVVSRARAYLSAELKTDIIAWGNDQPREIAIRRFVNLLRDLKGMVALS